MQEANKDDVKRLLEVQTPPKFGAIDQSLPEAAEGHISGHIDFYTPVHLREECCCCDSDMLYWTTRSVFGCLCLMLCCPPAINNCCRLNTQLFNSTAPVIDLNSVSSIQVRNASCLQFLCSYFCCSLPESGYCCHAGLLTDTGLFLDFAYPSCCGCTRHLLFTPAAPDRAVGILRREIEGKGLRVTIAMEPEIEQQESDIGIIGPERVSYGEACQIL